LGGFGASVREPPVARSLDDEPADLDCLRGAEHGAGLLLYDMLLLSVLREAPAHGYAVVERLAEVSEGEFALGEGTVYPALRRLEKAELLRSSWTRFNGRDRRVYEVTAKGERALAGQRKEWDRFAGAVRRTLESSG